MGVGFKAKQVKTRQTRKWLGWLLFILFFGTLFLLVRFLDLQLRPQIVGVAEGVARQMASQAITDMLYKRLSSGHEFSNLVVVDRDNNGHITSARFDLSAVARIESISTLEVQKELLQLEKRVVYIPALQTFGGSLFASIGPSIPVRIVPMGSVESRVVPEVKTAGINQTVHILSLNVTAQVGVVVPFMTEPVRVVSTLPIAYMVLVGSVPDVVGGMPGLYQPLPNLGNNSSH